MSRRETIGIALLGIGLMLILFAGFSSFIKPPSGMWYGLVAMGFALLAIIFHELAHGLAFYLYTGKVKFGIRWRTKLGVVAYTLSPSSILPKSKMIVAALAPQVLTIVILATLLLFESMSGWLSYSLLMFALMNFGGGCGDLHGVWLLLHQKGEIYVEDTGTSTIIYRRGVA